LAKAKLKLKLKTHKGAAKRFKLTAGGKIMRGHAFSRHILTSKPSKKKRKLDINTTVSKADAPHIRAMLPYGR
jgi:large subunit ribosomal protein L35